MDGLGEDEGIMAVCLARYALERHIGGDASARPALTPGFDEKRGVFVTLKKNGDLRGCIGYPHPILPLRIAITKAAVAAATEDPRFPRVRPDELKSIALEVTVLTTPRPLTCAPEKRPEHIETGRHGLIVSGMGTGGLLLPQVAEEFGWNSTEFLEHTCLKAGLPAGCWKQNQIEIMTFEGQVFKEQRSL